ncbi:MAG: Stp1/IreP family PP2C-type Ser/Thr phosphatase [Bacillota bacterium]|nr:Stp1/IreP family PP2C-type Ser/Thr phosphatase [Bacillota bacterium]
MRVVGISDIGLQRKKNEDRLLIDEEKNLYVVCDGMGGHKGGDVAATLAVNCLKETAAFSLKEDASGVLLQAVVNANQCIWERAKGDTELYEMGTTITAAVVVDLKLVVAHVGDSSIFLVRDNQIRKISQDHTLAEQMYKDGLLNKEDSTSNRYNHVLTRALGVYREVEIDLYSELLQSGDHILLCTDGLTDLLTEAEILEALINGQDTEAVLHCLVKLALDRGGHDNITMILISV